MGENTQTLHDKEFAILWELATHAGQVVMRKRLIATIWGFDANIETRSLDVYVSRVRQCMKQMNINSWRILSLYSAGYRLDNLPLGDS